MTKASHFNLTIFWALVKAQQSLLHNPPLTSLRVGGGGDFHKKRAAVLVIPSRVCISEGVQPHNIYSGSFHSSLEGTEPKKKTWDCVVLQWVPLRGEKNFKPHPQNRILVPLGGFLKISDEHHHAFIIEVPLAPRLPAHRLQPVFHLGGLPRCKNLWIFLCFVAIVRVRVYYVDFFVFFVLRHWWVSQVLTPRQSPSRLQS